jgi:hypothetical protein
MLAEGIVPDDPIATDQSQFFANNTYMCGVFGADSDIERPGGLQHIDTGRHPIPRPMQILIFFERVLVVIVLIANVKRRIGKGKIGERFFDLAQQFDAVAADDVVSKFMHVRIIQSVTAISRSNWCDDVCYGLIER